MNFLKLRAAIVEHDLKHSQVAERILGISAVSFSKKINGKSKFTLMEVDKLCREFGLSRDIFFDSEVYLKQTKERVMIDG